MVQVDGGDVGAGGEGADGGRSGADGDAVKDPQGRVRTHKPGGLRPLQVGMQLSLGSGRGGLQRRDDVGAGLGRAQRSIGCRIEIGLLVQVDDDANIPIGRCPCQGPQQLRLDRAILQRCCPVRRKSRINRPGQ